jgi:hypothetical protein
MSHAICRYWAFRLGETLEAEADLRARLSEAAARESSGEVLDDLFDVLDAELLKKASREPIDAALKAGAALKTKLSEMATCDPANAECIALIEQAESIFSTLSRHRGWKRRAVSIDNDAIRALLYDALRLHNKIYDAGGGGDPVNNAIPDACVVLDFDVDDSTDACAAGFVLEELDEQLEDDNAPPDEPDTLSRFLEEADRRQLRPSEAVKILFAPGERGEAWEWRKYRSE